jgi:FAD/FMN-containing dehydrogenase
MTTTSEALASTSAAALADLAARIRGEVHLPGTDDYVRLGTPWNRAVASRPLAVAAVEDAEDVVAVVRWAAEHGVQVAVRSTGHGAADELDGTLLVHTGRLDELTVSPDGRARAGAGVHWDRILEEGGRHGLAALAGAAPGVGVVGFLTGGGLGPLARTYGVSSDRVRGFDLVTGDGVLRHVTADQEPALFWGLKGAKGALGIVTAVELDLIPLPTLLGGALFFDGADADRVLHTWAAWCEGLPADATTSIAICRMPPMPGVPEPLAGRTTVAVRFAWTGDTAEGEGVLQPIRDVAPVIFGTVGALPSAAMGVIHSDPVDPMPTYERATMLSALPPRAVDALLAVAGPASDCPQIIVELRQLGGAVDRASRADGSFSARGIAFTLLTIGIDAGPVAAETRASAQSVATALAPWDTGRQLPNLAPSTEPEQALKVYDRDVLGRLGALVATVDPDGVISASRPIREACLLVGV